MNSSKSQTSNFEWDLWTPVTEAVTPIGWTIQRFLTANNLMQKNLAYELGIAPSNLSATLRGKKERPLSDQLVNNISKAFNLTPDGHLILEHAAQLSMTNFSIETSLPWKYALAARFHRDLKTMTPETAQAIDALLTTDCELLEGKTLDLIVCG